MKPLARWLSNANLLAVGLEGQPSRETAVLEQALAGVEMTHLVYSTPSTWAGLSRSSQSDRLSRDIGRSEVVGIGAGRREGLDGWGAHGRHPLLIRYHVKSRPGSVPVPAEAARRGRGQRRRRGRSQID